MRTLLIVVTILYLTFGWTWVFRKHVRTVRADWPTIFGWDDILRSAFVASVCCPIWIIWIACEHFGWSAYQFALIVGGETPEEKASRRERKL